MSRERPRRDGVDRQPNDGAPGRRGFFGAGGRRPGVRARQGAGPPSRCPPGVASTPHQNGATPAPRVGRTGSRPREQHTTRVRLTHRGGAQKLPTNPPITAIPPEVAQAPRCSEVTTNGCWYHTGLASHHYQCGARLVPRQMVSIRGYLRPNQTGHHPQRSITGRLPSHGGAAFTSRGREARFRAAPHQYHPNTVLAWHHFGIGSNLYQCGTNYGPLGL